MAFDPDYAKVALLLHGDGVNGSATIVDSGPLGLVPSTVPASVRISTDQATAFGGSAIKFSGSNPLLYAHHASLAPTGDYCIDVRLFTPAVAGAAQRTILIKSTSTGHRSYSLEIDADGAVRFTASNAAGTSVVLNRSSTDKVVVGFNRIEAGRIGNNVYFFLNGVLQWVNAFTGANYINASHPLSIGNVSTSTYPLSANGNAYIEELRITAGAGRHTASYTPETEAFPDVGTFYALSGAVTGDTGSPAARLIRAYREDTGALAGSATSDAGSGAYSIVVDTGGAHTLNAYPAAGESLPTLTLRGVLPA